MALKKRFREEARNKFRCSFCFSSVLSGLDDCYYCNNIIVSLLFKLCAKFSPRLQERSKSRRMLSRNRFCLLDGKIRDESTDHLFDLNFLTVCSIQLSFRHLSEFFYLSCRSTSKKFFSLCCSIFLSFCPCFSFRSFANLKLAYSLQKLLGRQEK